MRQVVRLIRLAWTVVTQTQYLSRTVRRFPADEQPRYRAQRQLIGCQRICRIMGIRVTVEGELPASGKVLAVCNHFGVLDPIVIASRVPVALAGKAEIANWPIIGWIARVFGVIFVYRERLTKTSSFVAEVQDRLRHGVGVLVFPEGTTFRGKEVHPFKTGSFEAVAGLADAAVLPMYLTVLDSNGRPADANTREPVTWAGGTQTFIENVWGLLGLKGGHMHLRIGEPIPTAGADRKELATRAHAAVFALSDLALYGPEVVEA